jgi:hypothetical protein
MVTTSQVAFFRVRRVLMLAMLITYFASMLGSVETGLRALAHVSVPLQGGQTIAYEVFNASSNTVALD